jgi:hypothetical protein
VRDATRRQGKRVSKPPERFQRADKQTPGFTPATQAGAIWNDSTRQHQAREDGKDQKLNWKTRQQSILVARSYAPGQPRP